MSKAKFGKWIPIKEGCEMPDNFEQVLLSYGNSIVYDDEVEYGEDGKIYLDSGEDWDSNNAWMPMPKPLPYGTEEDFYCVSHSHLKRLRELISNHEWDGIPPHDDEADEEVESRHKGYVEGIEMCLRDYDQWCAEEGIEVDE